MKPLPVGFNVRNVAFMETRPDRGVLELRRVARTSAAGGRSPLLGSFFTFISTKISICSGLRPVSTRRKSRFERRALRCSIYPQRLR